MCVCVCVCVCTYLCIFVCVCVPWDSGEDLCVCACTCVCLCLLVACVQVKWSILMWGFKSAGGAEDRRKRRSRWIGGKDYRREGVYRVRVGSEVEGGQVEFECVCLGVRGGWTGQLKRHRCVCDRQGSCMINLSRQMEVGRSRALGSSFSGCENCEIQFVCVRGGGFEGWEGGGHFLLAGDGPTDGCWFRSLLRGLFLFTLAL